MTHRTLTLLSHERNSKRCALAAKPLSAVADSVAICVRRWICHVLQSEALPSAQQLAEKNDGAANPFDGFTYVDTGDGPSLGGAAAVDLDDM